MPNESAFTKAIEKLFRDRGAVTVSEYQQAAGMSRQAAYQWRDRNMWRMAKSGKGRAGADTWLLLGVSPGTVKNLEGKGVSSLESTIRIVMALGLVDELAQLFELKAVQSIAQMERSQLAERKRAPRRAKLASKP